MKVKQLPAALSPCQNVRRSCYSLMNEQDFFNDDDDKDENANNNNQLLNDKNDKQNRSRSNCSDRGRSVDVNLTKLNSLAKSIARSILQREGISPPASQVDCNLESEFELEFAEEFDEWDAAGWHYTGASYSRPHLDRKEVERQRYERVALYVMVLDAINFCFWPVDEDDDNHNEGMMEVEKKKKKKNLLEYEHLAMALKEIAEQDDVISSMEGAAKATTANNDYINNPDDNHDSHQSPITRAEDSYALAPQNLTRLTPNQFLHMIQSRLPTPPPTTTNNNDGKHPKPLLQPIYTLPNPSERTRLLHELSHSLLHHHSGSASFLLAKCHQSADELVRLLLRDLPGFRDSAITWTGRWIGFYKRAQILVADLWAALGNGQSTTQDNHGDDDHDDENQKDGWSIPHCRFGDIHLLTTFADYRVPQLLRNVGVLQYSQRLAFQVDQGVELSSGGRDEICIRAGTVVAVDRLVEEVRREVLMSLPSDLVDGEEGRRRKRLLGNVNAVKMDWYLWNIGERLDREGKMENHHLVRTIFY